MKKPYLIPILIFLILILVTTGVVLYGSGVGLSFIQGKPSLVGTGLLHVQSSPKAAEVLINGHLTTATENTIKLLPGTYDIKMQKEGYFPWEKHLVVQKEVVTEAAAVLFPVYPSLERMTITGVQNPVIDPTHTHLAYTVTSQNPKKNGIYVLDLTSRPILTLQSGLTQVADDTTGVTLSNSQLIWSPDGKQLLASVSAGETNSYYLLDAGGYNATPQDVTETLASVKATWQTIKAENVKAQLAALPLPVRKLVTANFRILAYSPDETKILYQATTSATLPYVIKPRLIGINSVPEQRTIERGSLYVYDIKADQNYKISVDPKLLPNVDESADEVDWLRWFPDSSHLVYTHDSKIDVMEYDNTNLTTIYAGPFVNSTVFVPENDATRIIILTNLGNTNVPLNLYAIGLQ